MQATKRAVSAYSSTHSGINLVPQHDIKASIVEHSTHVKESYIPTVFYTLNALSLISTHTFSARKINKTLVAEMSAQ